jgi:hypothetical protein
MTEDSQRRYLLLLPAPEEEWAKLPDSEHELGMRNHQRFHEALSARGHKLVMGNPLEPSQQAISMRNTGRGSVIVTDGPFTEAAEQMVGFYVIDSGDELNTVWEATSHAAIRCTLMPMCDPTGTGSGVSVRRHRCE